MTDLLGSSESESGDSSFRSTVSTLSEATVESVVESTQLNGSVKEVAESNAEPHDALPSGETSPAPTPKGALGLENTKEQLATPLKASNDLEAGNNRKYAAKPVSQGVARLGDTSFAGSDLSFTSDMDSPMARGPVKIPVFSVPSPRNTPVRGLAPSTQDTFAVPDASDTLVLPPVDSPAGSPRPMSRDSSPAPFSAFTPEARQKVYETLPPSQRPSRILKSSHIRTHSKSENRPPTPTEEVVRTKVRAKAIRSELDSIFKAKCAGFGLPRSLNSSTSAVNSSAVVTPRRPGPSPVKDLATKPVKMPSPTTKLVKKPSMSVSGLPRPTLSIPTAKKRPESSLSRSTASTAAKAAPPSRPALTVSRRTAAVSSRVTVSASATGRSVVVPIRPAATPIRMKQHVYEQPASARARPVVVGAGGSRPTLGPAARLVRDPSSGGLVYATSGGLSLNAEFAPIATPRSAVAQFAPRSPVASFTPRSPGFSFGRPTRPGGVTPTPQRLCRTAGGLGVASRTGTLRQPSPTRNIDAPTPLVRPNSGESSSSECAGSKFASGNAPEKDLICDQGQAESSQGGIGCGPEPSNSLADPETKPTTPADEAATELSEGSPNGDSNDRPNGHSEDVTQPESDTEGKEKRPSPPTAEATAPVSASGRPRRTPKPVNRLVQAPVPQKADVTPSIAPGLSEKELKTQTQRNTMRNQVYFCAIDRQIVRIPGPRPPSPTGNIRTLAEKDEEEQKAERDARARRRRGSGSDTEDEAPPVIEKVHIDKAPGDEEDGPWKTPLRKRKRVIVSSDDEGSYEGKKPERNVRWDRALTVFRGGLGEATGRARRRSTGDNGHDSMDTRRTHSEEPSRSSLKNGNQIQLDKSGNAVDRPVEKLKRQKITVTAVFYDGEEPVPEPAKNTRSKKKKNA